MSSKMCYHKAVMKILLMLLGVLPLMAAACSSPPYEFYEYVADSSDDPPVNYMKVCEPGRSGESNAAYDEELAKGCREYYVTPLSVATTFYAVWNPQKPTTTGGDGTWSFTNGVLECTLKDGYFSSASLPVPGRGWRDFWYNVRMKTKKALPRYTLSDKMVSLVAENTEVATHLKMREVVVDPLHHARAAGAGGRPFRARRGEEPGVAGGGGGCPQ